MSNDNPTVDLSGQVQRRSITPTRIVLIVVVLLLAVRLVWRLLGRG